MVHDEDCVLKQDLDFVGMQDEEFSGRCRFITIPLFGSFHK